MSDYVFVVGNQKSGTSLLVSLLDSHPQLRVLPLEVKLFYFAPIYSLPPGSLHPDKSRSQKLPYNVYDTTPKKVLSEIINNFDFKLLKAGEKLPRNLKAVRKNINVSQFFDVLAAKTPSDYSDIYDSIFDAWEKSINKNAPRHKHSSFVEKTPNQEEYAAELSSWFPNATFLHVLRNPYANLYSLVRGNVDITPKKIVKGSGKIRDLRNKALKLMAKSYYFMEKNKRVIPNYHIIKFEDIVLNTKQTISQIADVLEIKNTESLKYPTVCGERWGGNSRTSESKFDGINSGVVDAYKGNITNIEKYLINKHFSQFTRRYKYDLLDTPSIAKCLYPSLREGILGYVRNRLSIVADNL